MTLEDFFTLAEIKDGFTAPARIEELVSVMQKEKKISVKNVGEAARQWSTVASTLSATENKDCLNLFIGLDGLQFLNKWLQDAQKYSNDISENSVEESVIALLGALEKLPIGAEISISSGIGETVKALFGQKNLSIQDRAKALSNSWNQGKDNDENNKDVEKGEKCRDDEVASSEVEAENEHSGRSTVEVSSVDNHAGELSQGELQHSRSSDSSKSESGKNTKIPESNDQEEEDGSRGDGVGSSIVSDLCRENSMIESSKPPSEGTISTQIHSPGVAELKDFTDDAKKTDIIIEESELYVKKNSPLDVDTDMGMLASEPKTDGDCNVLPDTSSNEFILRKHEFSKLSQPMEEETEVVNDAKQISGESSPKTILGDESVIGINASRHARDSKASNKLDKKYEMEFEYGVVDPLEVARQVAKEVEREVEGYREPLYSTSSEKNSGGGVSQPDSPNSINGELDQAIMGQQNEVPIRQNLTGTPVSPKEKEHLICSKNMDIEHEDPESAPLTKAAQEPASSTGKGTWVFDLNQEIVSEEMEPPPKPISAPIIVVTSSKAVTAPGLPVTPLHFEGTLGWKGSASTSAFRPASPRRTPDFERTFSIGGSSNSSKKRQNILDFDLNVAEGDDGVTDPVVPTLVPISLGLPSRDSSVEVSSRRAERLKFDLNRMLDNDDHPSADWRTNGGGPLYNHRNDHLSPSPASSSSSRQPSMKNIDLNDSPSFFGDSNDHRLGLGKSFSGKMNGYVGFKLHEPVISRMGPEVEVDRKENLPQTQSFLPNGLMADSVMGVNLTRSGGSVGAWSPAMAYPHPHFGYNGINMGPTMSFSPAMYEPGSVPGLVDSRGAPVVPPQIMGSPVGVPPFYSQPPPFLRSVTGPSATRPNLDLNTGFMMGDSENRESGGLRHFLIPGQSGLMEEQTRSMTQPFISGIGGKRKEPDGGWDPYSMGYKQQQPWH